MVGGTILGTVSFTRNGKQLTYLLIVFRKITVRTSLVVRKRLVTPTKKECPFGISFPNW